MTRSQAPIDERIVEARTGLVMSHPFFATLALNLDFVPDNSGTMWTNGSRVGFDPAFLDTLTAPQIKGLIAHEVMHVAQGHCWRRGMRDAQLWNHACDYVVNKIVKDAGMELPPDGKFDDELGRQHAEAVYDILLQRQPPQQQPQTGQGQAQAEGQGDGQPKPSDSSQGKGDPSANDDKTEGDGDNGDGDGDSQSTPAPWGEVRDAPSPEDGGITEEENNVRVLSAYNTAKMLGKVPGGLERLIETIVNPQVDWRAALHTFFQRTAKADYSWRKPNKRYLARGIILPSLDSEAMPPFVIAVDTSGSIGTAELAAFEAEINAIVDQTRPERVYVVYIDTDVRAVQEFEPFDPIKLEAKGGDGTRFTGLWPFIEAEGWQPACCVFLTDGCTYEWGNQPEYPVLWALTYPSNVPWGETLEMFTR